MLLIDPRDIAMTDPTSKALSQRINFRLIAFLVIIAAPFVGLLYAFVTYNGGVRHTADGEAVDLKALGNFAFNETSGTINDVPAKWRALDGKKVVLEGYMYSPNAAGQSRDFVFVYNVAKCCFGGPPQVQERVFVHVPEGRTIQYFGMYDFVRMIGTLHVKVEKNEGVIASVYTLDPDKAELKQ